MTPWVGFETLFFVCRCCETQQLKNKSYRLICLASFCQSLSFRGAAGLTDPDTQQQAGLHRTAIHTPLSSGSGQFFRMDAQALLSGTQSEEKSPTHRRVPAARGRCRHRCVRRVHVHGGLYWCEGAAGRSNAVHIVVSSESADYQLC